MVEENKEEKMQSMESKNKNTVFTIVCITLGCVAILIVGWSTHYTSLKLVDPTSGFEEWIPLIVILLLLVCGVVPILLSRFMSINGVGRQLTFILTAALVFVSLGSGYEIANAIFDDAPATKTPAYVTLLRVGKGKTRHSYEIQVKSESFDGIYRFEVPLNFYQQVSEGDTLILHIKQGYFGKRWLSKFERIKGKATDAAP